MKEKERDLEELRRAIAKDKEGGEQEVEEKEEGREEKRVQLIKPVIKIPFLTATVSTENSLVHLIRGVTHSCLYFSLSNSPLALICYLPHLINLCRPLLLTHPGGRRYNEWPFSLKEVIHYNA